MIYYKLLMICGVNVMNFGRIICPQYFNFYLNQRFQIEREAVSNTFVVIVMLWLFCYGYFVS